MRPAADARCLLHDAPELPMPRPPRPDDLSRLRVATQPRLSPDGSLVTFVVQTVAPGQDGYRDTIWVVPADGSRPARQLTIGAKHDRQPRFSPDGRTLAFLSDRRLAVEEDPAAAQDPAAAARDPKGREDAVQVHLLPLEGGEARRLTDLPRGVTGAEWSPDGRQLVVLTKSYGATRKDDARRRGKTAGRKPGSPPESDYRYIDRLGYMFNGAGFIYDQVPHLWLVDAATGEARRLTDGPTADESPARQPPSPAEPMHCSMRRPGCRTAGRSRRSVAAYPRTPTATTSGCSPRTARTPAATAGAICPASMT
jgi:dipeptidyl aminopeptidase/acylaminoacyl peptidase